MSTEKELKDALIFQKAVVDGLYARFDNLREEWAKASRELSAEMGVEGRKLAQIESEYNTLMARKDAVVIWDDSLEDPVEKTYYSADECPCSISKQVYELVLDFGDYIKMGCVAGRPA